MVRIYNSAKVVRTSQNLRHVLDNHRVRKTSVDWIMISKLVDGRGRLRIKWKNGDFCSTEFASYEVLSRFVKRPVFAGITVSESQVCNYDFRRKP